MRGLSVVCAFVLLAAPGSHSSQDQPGIAQLAEELRARSEPGPWGEAAGPLVRDRMLLLSEAATREQSRWAADFLKRVEALPSRALVHDDWVTWSLLRWEAGLMRERADFFWLDVPITPYASPLRAISGRFAGAPLESPKDRLAYLDGLHQLGVLATQLEAKLRGQAARGVVLPAAQIEAVTSFLRTLAAAPESSPFAVPAARLERVPQRDRSAFDAAVRAAIAGVVSPGFNRLVDYVEGPYRRGAPAGVGLHQYPGGDAYYRFLVRQHTTLDLTPQQIHEIGLQEVSRLEQELDAARRQARFDGSLGEFRTFLKTDRRFFPTTAAQIGDGLMAAAARIEPKLSEFFSLRPKAPYGVRRLAPFLEPLLTYGYYQIPTAQEPTGYYLYNGSKLEERSLLNVAALSYHELVPGHHFQLALTLENPGLSPFRRDALYAVFTEGWGEYASDLAGEMGMFDDPYARAGRLSMDLFLSTRLVVDTGMNGLGWTRERAVAFMREHTLESDTQIATETLRYSTDVPGQALAYKLGSRGIRALRERTRARLGSAFDIRRFHEAVIAHGAMPLGVLEEHLERVLGSAR